MNKPRGVYIHIPFCVKKCAYCDFYSAPVSAGVSEYTNALKKHIRSYRGLSCDTVYIGGGTPSCIGARELCGVIDAIGECLEVSDGAEISVECNPGTVTHDDFLQLREAGVNRVSVGAQSADDGELHALGRIHSHAQTKAAIDAAQRAGITNVNADLMYGIPSQTVASYEKTLDEIIKTGVTHISAYALQIEEGTPFYERKDALSLPCEDAVCDMLKLTCERLARAGIQRYEISNFARPGFECAHNMKYWHGEEYIAFGPSAASYYRGVRYSYRRSTGDYIRYANGEIPRDRILTEVYEPDAAGREQEYIMLSLRLCEGLSKEVFRERFGCDFDKKYGKRLTRLIDGGFMISTPHTLCFTPRGFLVSNEILCGLL